MLKSVPECGLGPYISSTGYGAMGGFYVYESSSNRKPIDKSNGKLFDLLMVNKNSDLKELSTNISISNGLTWVRTTNKFYYVDSCAYNILEYDYDPETGHIGSEYITYEY